MLNHFQIIAFTHSSLNVNEIGALHIEQDQLERRLNAVKMQMNWSEFQFLSTCNRVEILFCGPIILDEQNAKDLFAVMYPSMDTEQIKKFSASASFFVGTDAVNHLFRVASSIDSMVVGEREIITQVRKSYENCHALGLTGDFLRLLTKQTIHTAKKVYTQTDISKNPVSVVSLAYKRMKELNIPMDARVVVVGAGATNTTLSRFLRKHGFSKFAVFNRTLSKAESLAKELKGTAHPLSELGNYKEGFDVLIACTGTDHHLVTPELYESLLRGEKDKKVVIDIAIPQDLHPQIIEEQNVFHISVSYLQEVSDKNLKQRSSQIGQVERIIAQSMQEFEKLNKERKIEIAMRGVPQKVKDIKTIALTEVFKDDMANLDDSAKELLEKIVGYMEKKYMSVPMKMAKEILLNNQ